jgi:predicted secreted protein
LALVGHAAAVRAATSDATGSEIDGIKSIDWGPNRELIDTTDFADTTVAHTRLAGLKDLSVTISGDYEASDTGQGIVRTGFDDGSSVWIRFLPNGSTGFKCECKVQEFKITAGIDGTIEFSATLMGTGAIGTV